VPDEWLTVEEAMAYLKLSRSSVYRFMSEGRLPYYQVAGTGTRRFKRSDLDALLEPGQASPGKAVAVA
jgi:excisionase family DNA binding protein